jgi:hypothetical protein
VNICSDVARWQANPATAVHPNAAGLADVLVKYTYFGDADLNGVVDNTTDYDLWSTGFAHQGTPLAGGAPAAPTQSAVQLVPEPSSCRLSNHRAAPGSGSAISSPQQVALISG